MHITQLIEKKKHAKALTQEEIEWWITQYVAGEIPEYQVSALLMAIWFSGMTSEEAKCLTQTMVHSGETVDLSAIHGMKVDKHSSGGVADTTTLVVAPLVAAAGGQVAKMSGRGLGHTGGTLDKLESIEGFRIALTPEEFAQGVNTHGLAVMGQTGNLVPADKKLYALRDVTATVDSIPLIASSIMSKKLASGADKIVLDVKWGSGAFMPTKSSAEELASLMVDIGTLAGRETVALVTNMNQPLGLYVGNALEVAEAIHILQGKVQGDLTNLSLHLAGEMLLLGGQAATLDKGIAMATEALASGKALQALANMIAYQGGDPEVVQDTAKLPQASDVVTLESTKSGYITHMNAAEIGRAAMLLGAGRESVDDVIDPAVGLVMRCRIGDNLAVGDPIADFHINSRENLEEAVQVFHRAIEVGTNPAEPEKLIALRVDAQTAAN